MDLGRKQMLNEADNDIVCSWLRAKEKSQSLHRKARRWLWLGGRGGGAGLQGWAVALGENAGGRHLVIGSGLGAVALGWEVGVLRPFHVIISWRRGKG